MITCADLPAFPQMMFGVHCWMMYATAFQNLKCAISTDSDAFPQGGTWNVRSRDRGAASEIESVERVSE